MSPIQTALALTGAFALATAWPHATTAQEVKQEARPAARPAITPSNVTQEMLDRAAAAAAAASPRLQHLLLASSALLVSLESPAADPALRAP